MILWGLVWDRIRVSKRYRTLIWNFKIKSSPSLDLEIFILKYQRLFLPKRNPMLKSLIVKGVSPDTIYPWLVATVGGPYSEDSLTMSHQDLILSRFYYNYNIIDEKLGYRDPFIVDIHYTGCLGPELLMLLNMGTKIHIEFLIWAFILSSYIETV